MLSKLCQDPFRIYFPFAIVAALAASLVWLLYGLFEVGEFPLEDHANLFMGGYLYFSIMGFLLTAIPRFTQTSYLSRAELFISFLLVSLTTVFFFNGDQLLLWGSIFLGWPYLAICGGRRFLKRGQNPPYTFIFVGLGILLGSLGSLLLFLSFFESLSVMELSSWGKILFYDSMVMAFILGVGGRLIPGILGYTDIVQTQKNIYETPDNFWRVVPKEIYFLVLIFILTILFEGLGHFLLAYLGRALVITFFSFKYWRLHESVRSGKWHGKMIKLSCWFLLVGSWLLCFFMDYAIHVRHLIYIGSYFLLTLMVSSRVILAHSGSGLELERGKIPFLLTGGLIALAALTRASAILMPQTYFRHLGYAALVLLGAVVFWSCAIMLRKAPHR